MSVGKTPKSCFHYRMTHKGFNYDKSNFWQPGDPLTEADQILLRGVKDFYREKGYPPSREDMKKDVGKLKHRFRIWKNVLIAAELPALNDAETQSKRQNIKKTKRDCPQSKQ